MLSSCGIPSCITCSTITPGAYPRYHGKQWKKKKDEHERAEKKNRIKQRGGKEEENNEANMRSGHTPSLEDKNAVCWHDQSYDMSS